MSDNSINGFRSSYLLVPPANTALGIYEDILLWQRLQFVCHITLPAVIARRVHVFATYITSIHIKSGFVNLVTEMLEYSRVVLTK